VGLNKSPLPNMSNRMNDTYGNYIPALYDDDGSPFPSPGPGHQPTNLAGLGNALQKALIPKLDLSKAKKIQEQNTKKMNQ